MKKTGQKLTPEMIAQMPGWVDKWVKLGLSTEPADFNAAEKGVRGCYQAAGLKQPKIILRMDSPYGVIYGTAIAHNIINAEINKVYAQVYAQVDDQVHDQVYAQVRAQVYAQVSDQVSKIYRTYRGGNLWAGWYAHVSFLRDVVGWKGDKLNDFFHDELIAKNAGWTIWTETVAAISDRPKNIRLDDEGRLHCVDGPAIFWRDGYTLCAWHGVRIPAEWTRGSFPSAKEMLFWKNIEQRRAGCSMLGWSKILKEINAKVIDKDNNPMVGTLMEADIPDSGIERFLVVECGTGRKGIVLPVSREANTALEANASTWGLKPDQYKPEVRS